MKTFYIPIKFIVAFHFSMLQQFHLSREDIGEAYTILAYCFTDSLCSRAYTSINQWCLKTSRTTTKVQSFLKILLPSMRVDRFPSCENIVPRFQTLSILPPPPPYPPNWSLNLLEETFLQAVIKSFITFFTHYNEGLEYKLMRVPLFGLAKSVYYCNV